MFVCIKVACVINNGTSDYVMAEGNGTCVGLLMLINTIRFLLFEFEYVLLSLSAL